MKEAIAWHYQGLMVLGLMAVGWLVALTVAAATTSKLESLHRFLVIGIVGLSFPAYIAYGFWYAEYSPKSLKGNQRLRLAGVEEQTVLYKKLCSAGQPIVVTKTIESPEPVNIRIEERSDQRLGYELLLTRPWHPATAVCWLDQSSEPCADSNIRQVEFKQWVFSGSTHYCDLSPYSRPKHCVEKGVRYDRKTRERSEAVATITSGYILSVSGPEILGPQVIKFPVSIKNEGGEVLAHTSIFKRLPFGDMPRPLSDEPPHCPPRDSHIAELLGKVFPMHKLPR